MGNASEFSWDLTDTSSTADAGSGGGGSALSGIMASLTQLGTAAIQSFGPQNSALATNPTGQGLRYPTTQVGGMNTILAVAVLAVIGLFAYKAL